MKYIVVGSSHGGYESVRGILKEDPKAEIQWYEMGDFISFLSCGMQLYLEGVVKDVNNVSYATPEGAKKAGVHVFEKSEINHVDPDKHTVHVLDHNNGSERDEHYDKLFLSVGAVPNHLPVKGNDLKNVYAMRGRDWAIRLKAKTVDPDVKNVVVVGSGYIGLEAAEVFAKAGKHVTMIDLNKRVLGNYLDSEFTDVLSKVIEDNHVTLAMGAPAGEYVDNGKGYVKGVTANGKEYPADLVVETAGVKPATSFLKGAVDLDGHGLIKVNKYMETSAKDIYAAGDSIEVPFAPTGKTSYIALASNARREGRTAALNAFGHHVPMTPVSGSSALSIFGYKFASTGIKEGTASKFGLKTESVVVTDTKRPKFVPDKDGNAKVWFKLTFDPKDGRVLGAQIMSKEDVTANINTISLAIQAGLKVNDLAYADFFFQPGFDRPWNIMNVAAQKAVDKLNK
ncbi:NADH peroxidase [Philodulcilactobacillus myokoensis]|uniref:NADH peroxidase n=1 Tax=Philodulcilactobacillus myokoensis TaxID=2929573 RepID=A0A9W6ESB6_9LACO|nr:FAD-dependent oxidoreductase [Philodulcilactobacillus myokoensis]GLB46342.1 NADH peroxidase [Philodulcilactobacillus myokoensis]